MIQSVQNDRSKLRQLAATFFVLVLLVFTSAEAVHAHSATNYDNPRTESHCLLCVAAHSAAAPMQVIISPITFESVNFQSVSEPQLYSRLFVPSSFIRPPPENL